MYLYLEHPLHGSKKLHIDEIQAITTKSRRTIERWIRQPSKIDSDSNKLLQLFAFGLIPSHNPIWARLFVDDDELFSLDQKRFHLHASEIGNVWLLHAKNRELKQQISQLKPRQKKAPIKSALIYDMQEFRKLGKAKA